VLDAATVERLARFARYWDLVANSGRLAGALALVLDAAPFARFMDLADWLYAATGGRTHAIAAERLYELVHRWLIDRGADADLATATLAEDYRRSGARGRLALGGARVQARKATRRHRVAARQARHGAT
jgi:hypothetical protein